LYTVLDAYESRSVTLSKGGMDLYAVWKIADYLINGTSPVPLPTDFPATPTLDLVTPGRFDITQRIDIDHIGGGKYEVRTNETYSATVDGNVIRISGTFASATSTTVQGFRVNVNSTGDEPLFLLLEGIRIYNGYQNNTVSCQPSSPISINNNSVVVIQYIGAGTNPDPTGTEANRAAAVTVNSFGNSIICADITINGTNGALTASDTIGGNAHAAMIRVAETAKGTATLYMQGQGNASLYLYRGSGNTDHVNGAGIGGNGGGRIGGTTSIGENGGIMNFESGKLFVRLFSTDSLHASGIGGGGTQDATKGGSGGEINIRGGKVTTNQYCSGISVSGAGIGGGAPNATVKAGSGGKITITGGLVTVIQDAVAVEGAGIGGAGLYDSGESGDSGTIRILGGKVEIKQGTGATRIGGAGIGTGGGDAGAVKVGTAYNGDNYIEIGGSAVVDVTTNSSGAARWGAGIGGGGNRIDNSIGEGGDARVIINGGTVNVVSTTSGANNIYSAGIGGGGSRFIGSAASPGGGKADVTINGGTIYVQQRCIGNGNVYAAGIGGGASFNSTAVLSKGTVTINGGTVTVERGVNTNFLSPVSCDIGDGGAAYSSYGTTLARTAVTVNGGSIYTSNGTANNATSFIGCRVLPKVVDSNGNTLYMTAVPLSDSESITKAVNSVYVMTQDGHYRDWKIASSHNAVTKTTITNAAQINVYKNGGSNPSGTGTTNVNDYLYLYLPGSDSGYLGNQEKGNKISVETRDDGYCKFYYSEGKSSTSTNPIFAKRVNDPKIQPYQPVGDGFIAYYRIFYKLEDKIKFNLDVVHWSDSKVMLFEQTFSPIPGADGYSAPSDLTYFYMWDKDKSPPDWRFWPEEPGWKVWDYTISPGGGTGTFKMTEPLTGKIMISLGNGVLARLVDPLCGDPKYPDHAGNTQRDVLIPLNSTATIRAPSEWNSAGSDFVIGWVDENGVRYGEPQSGFTSSVPIYFYALWGMSPTGLVFTEQPSDQVINDRANAVFIVEAEKAATGSSAGLTYQWQYNRSGTWTNIPDNDGSAGSKTSMLIVAPPSPQNDADTYMDGDQFRCVVSGTGLAPVTS
jgi:hypothetical protein